MQEPVVTRELPGAALAPALAVLVVHLFTHEGGWTMTRIVSMGLRILVAVAILFTVSLLIVPKKRAATPYQALLEQVTVASAKSDDCPNEKCIAPGWPTWSCGPQPFEFCGIGGVPPSQVHCDRFFCE